MAASGQIARVAIDDDQWLAFRQAALVRGISVSGYLGKLVQAELGRRAGRPVANIAAEMTEADQAVAALAEVRGSLDELNTIAGRLARAATEHGGSWADVASSLRLTPDQAKSAYQSAPRR